jgi:aspartyl-tRNA(Asn)/glutamyl-tRNA(Gln) amidotransferase subunit A
MIAYGSSLDQAGPFAAAAIDLVDMLDTISGFDPRDATSAERCNGQVNAPGRIRGDFADFDQAFGKNPDLPLQGLRIGVPREYFGVGLAAPVGDAVEAALAQFVALGATRVDISLPNTRLAIPAYYVIAPAEASSNLARYDGVRYGHRAADYTDLADMTGRSRAEGFGAEVQRRILVGTYVLSHGYYDAYYLQAQRIRRMIADDFQSALRSQCDVIMGPVTPTVARPIGADADDPTAEWLADVYTLGLNLAGLPGMSIPCGFATGASGKPLPVGLQIIGNYFDEGRLLAVAHQFQLATDWHQRIAGQA